MAEAALPSVPARTLATPLDDRMRGAGDRVRDFLVQPAVRKALPALGALTLLAATAGLYLAIAGEPQRVLYASLSDGERAGVVTALETSGIAYEIDPATGMLSVSEDDIYRARMLVAADGALASPDASSEMLDAIPIGSSRTLEGERLRNVRERELVLTIEEIDGVESARVHLASSERSVFVRENVAPTASVMLRLARGRSLSQEQVTAIVNLVAGSVPGLTAQDVRVVDQRGRLLSLLDQGVESQLDLQREFEQKLILQVSELLTPMMGAGNFSVQAQVELDLSEMTSARESYDNDGVIRSESESSSSRGGEVMAGGIPGATTNTPPPAGELEEGAPEGGTVAPTAVGGNAQNSSERLYEVGREVAVTSTRPGAVQRISVAVALSSEAMEAIAPATAEEVQQLVAAAVGAREQRGDQVTVITGAFETVEEIEAPFWEAGWFDLALRYGVGLIVVLLGLFMGVRPILKSMRKQDEPAADEDEDADEEAEPGSVASLQGQIASAAPDVSASAGQDDLREQVRLARRIAAEQPERAVDALRRMLANPVEGAGA